MKFSFTILTVLLLPFAARASVISERGSDESRAASTKCVTKYTGTLGTSRGKKFAWNYRGELAYFHTTKHPTVKAEFQYCYPNWYGSTLQDDADRLGRVYLPATGQCLAVKNSNTNGPYQLYATKCPNSSKVEMATSKSWPFNFKSIANPNDYGPPTVFQWIGAYKRDMSKLQGGCEYGVWDFSEQEYPVGSESENWQPITDKAGEYRVSLRCGYSVRGFFTIG